MSGLTVKVEQEAYRPGEIIRGTCAWTDAFEHAESFAIRLVWFTSGKGDRDFRTVAEIELPMAEARSPESFEFVSPHRPLSFTGQLISLQWSVEVVAFPFKRSARADFAVTHGEEPIALTDKSDEATELGAKRAWFRMGKV